MRILAEHVNRKTAFQTASAGRSSLGPERSSPANRGGMNRSGPSQDDLFLALERGRGEIVLRTRRIQKTVFSLADAPMGGTRVHVLTTDGRARGHVAGPCWKSRKSYPKHCAALRRGEQAHCLDLSWGAGLGGSRCRGGEALLGLPGRRSRGDSGGGQVRGSSYGRGPCGRQSRPGASLAGASRLAGQVPGCPGNKDHVVE
jgi:hypothetical protein